MNKKKNLDQNDEISRDELNEIIEKLCLSKVDEFKILGYKNVSGLDIWECISEKYRKNQIPKLHRIVNDILTLKSTSFMNWLTLHAFKNTRN